MSEVMLLYVRDNQMFLVKKHYRKVLEQLNEKRFAGRALWLDSGYILVDFDRAQIINCQSSFKASDLSNKLLRRFSWVEL
jgi:hypothetical protein